MLVRQPDERTHPPYNFFHIIRVGTTTCRNQQLEFDEIKNGSRNGDALLFSMQLLREASSVLSLSATIITKQYLSSF